MFSHNTTTVTRSFTDLHYACKRNDVSKTKKLLELVKASDLWIQDAEGDTPLTLAARYNSVDCLKLLLDCDRFDDRLMEVKNDEGETALSLAWFHGHTNGVYLLSMEGAEFNTDKPFGCRRKNTHIPIEFHGWEQTAIV